MKIVDFFNVFRKPDEQRPSLLGLYHGEEKAGKKTNRHRKEGAKITAGGQITAPTSTIIEVQPQRFNLDLSMYKTAIRAAENMDYTQRVKLYDMYEDALFDTHVISVTDKRKNALRCSQIEFRRHDGQPDDRINANLKSPWFHSFIGDILDAQLWGFTLCQFTTGKDGYVDYFLVPRKHVDPQRRIIKRHQTDLSGISFDEYPNLLMIEGERKLGLLAACLPWTIRKNGTIGDWCQFSELFGMPIRDYAYDATDELARMRAMADAQAQGSAGIYIHQDTTKLSLIEAGNKSGSAEVYDSLVRTCNAELSKAILGNTLTTEASDTGTQALGTVHKKEEESIAEADRQFVLNVLNYHMTDIFAMMGIDTSGGEFAFAKEPKTLEEKAALIRTARNDLGLLIDDDYIYKELEIEKPDNYDTLKREEEEERKRAVAEQMRKLSEQHTAEEQTATKENKARFFDVSPDCRALNW